VKLGFTASAGRTIPLFRQQNFTDRKRADIQDFDIIPLKQTLEKQKVFKTTLRGLYYFPSCIFALFFLL
jgi:hypothetical protein